MQWRKLSKMPLLPCNTKDADYTKVDAAIAKANTLNKDNYKDFLCCRNCCQCCCP